MRLRAAPLNLSFADAFHGRQPDAYERLLMDVVRGNPMLFMRCDEVEAAWRWVEPMLDGWAAAGERSEEHTSELQSLMRISYAVFCLKKKIIQTMRSKNSNENDMLHRTRLPHNVHIQ